MSPRSYSMALSPQAYVDSIDGPNIEDYFPLEEFLGHPVWGGDADVSPTLDDMVEFWLRWLIRGAP